MGETRYRLTFGPNVLDFTEVDDLLAFASEQGCERVTYDRRWFMHAAYEPPPRRWRTAA